MKNLWILVLVLGFASQSAKATEDAALKAARQKLNGLNQMRDSLASTLKSKKKQDINEGIFQQVCVPVGKDFKSWAQTQGYTARQLSAKNRNPDHALRAEEISIYAEFENNKKMDEKIVPVEIAGRKGRLLYRRIPVAKSCLHCHGAQAERPDFIQKKYPNDKAYDFKPGDLRGLYSVFLPDTPASKP